MLMMMLCLHSQQQQKQLDEEHALKMEQNSPPSAMGSSFFSGSSIIRLIALIFISTAALGLYYGNHYQLDHIGSSVSRGLAMKIATDAVSMEIATDAVNVLCRRALWDKPKESSSDHALVVTTSDVKVTSTIPPLEQQALKDLYDSTDGPNWIVRDGWDFTDPNANPCSFRGVSCQGSNHVYSIHLSNNRLSGTIPSTIGQLTFLQELYLGRNQLIGTIPATIDQLSDLRILELDNNRLSGQVPVIGNQLVGQVPSSLCQLRRLQYLSFRDNLFDCYPDCLTPSGCLVFLQVDSGSIPPCSTLSE